MKKCNQFALLLLILLGGCTAATPKVEKFSDLPEDESFNFIVINDAGRNGYYDQKPIAAEMGALAERADIEFVATAGDTFHSLGVGSTADPLWMTNFELIYDHTELQVDWFPVLGNHEYHGNTQAVIDYSHISRRWEMPARYYTRSFGIEDDATLRLLMVDTAPLIDKYRDDEDNEYPDARLQCMERQLVWIDSVLTASRDTWTVVIGHHPIWAGTDKDEEERTDMQARLEPVLKKHGVDMYIAGHIHNFQHIRRPDSGIDYVVNGSASQGRKVVELDGQVFSSRSTGFSVVAASPDSLKLHMLDRDAQLLYTVRRGK